MKYVIVTSSNLPLFAPILQLPARYWQELQEEERKDENKVKSDGEQSKEALQQEDDKTQKAKKRKQDQSTSDGEKVKPEVRVHELLLTDKNHAIISCSCLNCFSEVLCCTRICLRCSLGYPYLH